MQMLTPSGFAAHPEINAAIRDGKPLDLERAKAITHEIIAGLRDQLPRVAATRDAICIVEDLRKAVAVASDTLARTDGVLLAEPDRFLTPNHELAHRASRIGRKIIVERNIQTEEDLEAIAPECYALARQEMGDRGTLPTEEEQDVTPLCLLRLRQILASVEELTQAMQAPVELLKFHLNLGLLPHQTGGRPPMHLAMFLAWLLQDATSRGMSDERVVTFLSDAFAELPMDAIKLAPSRQSVTRWRLEREKIPAIPRFAHRHKSK